MKLFFLEDKGEASKRVSQLAITFKAWISFGLLSLPRLDDKNS